MSNILYPIWECIHKGFTQPQTTPCRDCHMGPPCKGTSTYVCIRIHPYASICIRHTSTCNRMHPYAFKTPPCDQFKSIMFIKSCHMHITTEMTQMMLQHMHHVDNLDSVPSPRSESTPNTLQNKNT